MLSFVLVKHVYCRLNFNSIELLLCKQRLGDVSRGKFHPRNDISFFLSAQTSASLAICRSSKFTFPKLIPSYTQPQFYTLGMMSSVTTVNIISVSFVTDCTAKSVFNSRWYSGVVPWLLNYELHRTRLLSHGTILSESFQQIELHDKVQSEAEGEYVRTWQDALSIQIRIH